MTTKKKTTVKKPASTMFIVQNSSGDFWIADSKTQKDLIEELRDGDLTYRTPCVVYTVANIMDVDIEDDRPKVVLSKPRPPEDSDF